MPSDGKTDGFHRARYPADRARITELEHQLHEAQEQIELYREGLLVLRTDENAVLVDEILACTPESMREAEARLPEIEAEVFARLHDALKESD